MAKTPQRWTVYFRHSPLLAPAAHLTFWLLCCGWPLACADWAAGAQPQPVYQFRSGRGVGDTDRVVGLLEAGGEVKEAGDDRPRHLKMSVTFNFAYDERTVHLPDAADGAVRSIRRYEQADAVIKIEEDGFKPVLRPERRLIGAEAAGRTVTLFSPDGPLAREELDLIDIFANSLLLDRLLPEGEVAVGQSWKLPVDLVVALLGLDTAAESDVEASLTEVTETVARFQLAGRVQGAVGGVSSTIELKGKFRYSLPARRIDWLGLLVKEDRGISPAKRGVDAVARLQMTVVPVEMPPALSDAALEGKSLRPTEELLQIIQFGGQRDWSVLHDRSWYPTGEQADLVVLRKVVRGELIAQCNISPLPERRDATSVTLEQFQADVQQALGKSFGQFVVAGQYAGSSGDRVFRVVVHGTVEDLPIEWRYYLVTREDGRRVGLAFTLEQKYADELADEDKRMVDLLRFLAAETPPADRPAGERAPRDRDARMVPPQPSHP